MITIGGVATTAAGGTAGGDPEPRVLILARCLAPENRRERGQGKVMRLTIGAVSPQRSY